MQLLLNFKIYSSAQSNTRASKKGWLVKPGALAIINLTEVGEGHASVCRKTGSSSGYSTRH